MKIALLVGYIFFCSFWNIGACSFLHCYWCISYKSYEDCERNQSLGMGRHGVHGCLLQHVRFDNGSVQEEVFYKGIIPKKACHDWYETKSGHCSGDPFLKCREKCCYKDYCNKGNILDTNDRVSSSNEAVFISDGVVAMGLLLGVSLVTFSVNYL